MRLMTPMIAGILACIFCLVSMTWAWFNASVNTGAQAIQSANRSTSVMVYEIGQLKEGNANVTKTLVKPEISEAVSLSEEVQETDASVVMAGESLVWNLSPEKSYEVVMTGSGTASTGYCKVALSQTLNGSDTAETKIYKTSAFEKDNTVKFICNTGGFSDVEGVTETQYKEYVEKTTTPTLTIESYWGKSAENDTTEEIMLLSNGAVLGHAPIPRPEAKANATIELEGFEIQEGSIISAEQDYKISLILKEGYEMPDIVTVNIDGKAYAVDTQGGEASNNAPYYNAETHILTVPSGLLSDGTVVSVQAVATLIPVVALEEETNQEETDAEPAEEDNSDDAATDNNVVADDPTKEDEDEEQSSDKPNRNPIGSGGNNGNDETDNNSGDLSTDTSSSSDNNEEEPEVEKADVTLNLSQLTINLEETQIPTNADLVLTLSAKENMELPEKFVITLDKTIRDENMEEEEITEDKTEYIINTDGKDNPEGFEFDVDSGELTVSSELLEGVREITIADIEENESDEDESKATITFEVKNLTFDFTDDEIVTDEDVVITFTAGEGYNLPETIVITIDGEEYTVYTNDVDENPEGITFDVETGTLTITKALLQDVKTITITAEGTEKEDENTADKENNAADKENENVAGTPDAEDKTETEGGENTGTTDPEVTPDNTTDDKTEPETPEAGTEPDNTTTPGTEDNTNTEQGGENTGTEEKGEGSTENEGEETTEPTPGTEGGSDSEAPTEPTTPAEPSEPAVTPETPDASESTTGGNDSDDNSETDNADNGSAEGDSNSSNDSTESNASGESTTSLPTTSAPVVNETNTTDANTSSANDNSAGVSETSVITSSDGKETSSDE